MAQLSWRNVAAPDFSTSLAGIEASRRAMVDAFSGLRNSVGNVDDNISDRMNNAFQANLLRYNDADEYQSALSEDPTLGYNPRRLNAASIAAAGSRVDTLLGQETSRLRMDGERQRQVGVAADQEHTAWTRGNDRTRFDLQRSADDVVAQANSLVLSGNRAGAIQLLQENENFSSLWGQDQQAIVSDIMGNYTARLNQDGVVQNQAQSAYRFGREQISDQDTDAGQAAVARIQREALTVSDAMAMANSMGLSPGAYNYVMRSIGAPALINDFAGAGGGGAAGGGVVDDNILFRVTDGGAGNLGLGYAPSSLTTQGAVVDFARGLNNRGQESSAMGPYQIVGRTRRNYAQRLWGDNWRNVPTSLENDDAIARAIFEDHNGSAASLRAQWVSLSPADAERIRHLPWEQAREVIAAGETGVSPAAILASPRTNDSQNFNINMGLANQASQVNDPVAAAYQTNIGNNAPIGTVVSSLKENNPAFAGLEDSQIRTMIRGVQTRAAELSPNGRPPLRLNHSQAAAILAESVGTRGWGNWLMGARPGSDWSALGLDVALNNNEVIDSNALDTALNSIINGDVERSAFSANSVGQASAQQSSAYAALQNAQSMLSQAQARGLPPHVIAQYEQRLVQAQLLFDAVSAQNHSSGDTVLRTPVPARRGDAFGGIGAESVSILMSGNRPQRNTPRPQAPQSSGFANVGNYSRRNRSGNATPPWLTPPASVRAPQR